MNTRPVRKLLHFFDRKHLLQRRFRRFLALEKTHSIFRSYAELTDILISGKRLAGSVKALIKVNVQNTELDSFGFVVRKARNADPRHPLQQLSDLLRHEGQWLRVQAQDSEAAVRTAINAVLDARSFHVHLHSRLVFPPTWNGVQILQGIQEAELMPAGFALVPLEDLESGFAGTILRAGQERRAAALLQTLKPS
jgi:hypothetical protein